MNRDHVSWLGTVYQRVDGTKDEAMLVAIEVVLVEQVGHSVPCAVIKEKAPQHTRLSFQRMRWNA